jgi:hypothetical protein
MMNAALSPQYLLLLYVVIPSWLLAGFLDWLLHRRSNISATSGPLESVFHLVLVAELGLPVILILLFEVTATTLLVLLLASLLHSITAWLDSTYASRRRVITPLEQTVHAYLEVLPYTALLLLTSAHWGLLTDALFSEAGLGNLDLRWRDPPLPLAYLAGIFSAALALVLLPFLEELLRGLREQHRPRAIVPTKEGATWVD